MIIIICDSSPFLPDSSGFQRVENPSSDQHVTKHSRLNMWVSHMTRPCLAGYKKPFIPPTFNFFFFSSSYLPCLGGCDHEGGPPQIGPCIAQRGGTVCSTAFGSLTGVFFGTFHFVDLLFIKVRVSDLFLEKRIRLLLARNNVVEVLVIPSKFSPRAVWTPR